VVVGAVLVSLLAATAVSVWHPEYWAVGAVVAAGIAWWLVNGPVEGAVLLEVSRGRGVTVADLLVPLLVAVAVVALVRQRRRTGRAPGLDRPAGVGRGSRR